MNIASERIHENQIGYSIYTYVCFLVLYNVDRDKKRNSQLPHFAQERTTI